MKNKVNNILLSTLTAAFLVGCGGGGGSGSSTTTPSTATDVIVERGPLIEATVKDANGILATQKTGTNVYTFASTPTYPITVTGGYIDMDENGAISTGDVSFKGMLKSYSTVITPITSYIATGTTELERADKLNELKTKIGGTVSDDDLLKKVPSVTSKDVIVLANAIFDAYNVLFDLDTSNDNISNITTLDDKITSYYSVVTQSGAGKSVKELAKLVEEELITTKGISKLTENEVNEINNPSITLTTEMLSGKTYKLNDTDGSYVIFTLNTDGTSSETGYFTNGTQEYTESNSTWKIVDGKLQITLSDNSVDTYSFGTTPANGVKVTADTSDEDPFVVTISDFANIKSDTTTSLSLNFKGLEYKVITSPITNKKWLDRNLGATQACTSAIDTACYGDYYQWGRLADGHEKADSTTTSTRATSITNAGDKFITMPDWITNGYDYVTSRISQWNKTDGEGICPTGFRVPSFEELEAETTGYAAADNQSTGAVKVTNFTTAYQNFLKFPFAGWRSYISGSITTSIISVWTNTQSDNTFSKGFTFDILGATSNSYSRADGFSVRCIKEN